MKTHLILAIITLTALMGCEKKPQADAAKPPVKEATAPAAKEPAKEAAPKPVAK